ncbi:MAG: hypothetical protein ACTHJM_15705 [Marmoricola sp.]
MPLTSVERVPLTAPTSAPAPQLAAAARVVERDDGCLQIGIRPETSVRVTATAPLREALAAITHGERIADNPELLAALDGSGLFASPQPPGPFPVRIIGSLEGDVEAALEWAGMQARPRARLALVLSVGEVDRSALDPLVRGDMPHLLVRAIDGVVVLGPFVVPGATACVRCLDAHHSDEDPGYPIALERYVVAGAQPREDGCLDVPDPGNLALALAWAARDLRTFSAGVLPTTWSSTISIGGAAAPIAVVAWQPHPRCGCRWFESALGA